MSKNYVKSFFTGLFVASFLIFSGGVSAAETHVYWGQSIQSAVDLAEAGDVIIVHEGIYYQSVVFGPEDSGIALKGEEGTILDGTAPADPLTTLLVDGIRLSGGVSGVTIEGFEIRNYTGTGNGQGNAIQAWNSGTSDITIENNVMHHNSWNGILVGNEGTGLHTDWAIHDNQVYDNGWINIELTNVSDSAVWDNEAYGGGWNVGWSVGILIQARNTIPGSGEFDPASVAIRDNDISNVNIGIYVIALASEPLEPWAPIEDAYAELEGVVLTDNKIYNNSWYGIYCWGYGAGVVVGITIQDNTVNDNGIVFNNIEWSRVLDNKISGCGADGIALFGGASNNKVNGNKVTGSGQYGISLRGGASDNEVRKNKVSDSGTFDLHWDGTGTGNVWEENKYDSSNF